jgi:hypothetical protein
MVFTICSYGNALVDFKNEDAYYASPEQIFSFCKTISRRVVLRTDYMPFEFCVYVYKEDRISKRNVFEEFEQEAEQQGIRRHT